MKNNNTITYHSNSLTIENYFYISNCVGWNAYNNEQIATAIKRSLFTIVAKHNGIAVGMARVIGDNSICYVIRELAVIGNYQNQGIGTELLKKCLEFIRNDLFPKWKANVEIQCSKGTENFYKKNGFLLRPNSKSGSGMFYYF